MRCSLGRIRFLTYIYSVRCTLQGGRAKSNQGFIRANITCVEPDRQGRGIVAFQYAGGFVIQADGGGGQQHVALQDARYLFSGNAAGAQQPG